MSDIRDLPEGGGLGDRALVPQPGRQLPGSISPTISSLAVISDSLDAVADVMGDLDTVTVGDLEKLFSKHALTRKDIMEAVRDAFMQNISGTVRDQSLWVKSQVKADEVQRKSRPVDTSRTRTETSGADFKDIFKSSDVSRASENKDKSSLYETYHKVLDVLTTATTHPLALMDKMADFGIRKISGLFGKNDKNRQEKRSFGRNGLDRNSGQYGEEAFFGTGVGTSMSVQSPVSYGEVEQNPFAGIFDSLGLFNNTKVSNEENLQAEVAESDLRTNSLMFRTFDEPEKSDFGKFLGERVLGGDGNVTGKAGGILESLLTGALVVGLIFALPFILDKVIPFITGTLIPFVTGPLAEFLKAATPVALEVIGTLFKFVGGPLLNLFKGTISPLLVSAFKKLGDFLGSENVQKGLEGLALLVGKLVGFVWDEIVVKALDSFFKVIRFIADNWAEDSKVTKIKDIREGDNIFESAGHFAITSASAAGRNLDEAFLKWEGKTASQKINDFLPLFFFWATQEGDVTGNPLVDLVKLVVDRAGKSGDEASSDEKPGDGAIRAENDFFVSSKTGEVVSMAEGDSAFVSKGDFSILPANQVNGYSGNAGGGGIGSPFQSSGVVTNNYVNNSNFNFAGLTSPAPEFDPLGV